MTKQGHCILDAKGRTQVFPRQFRAIFEIFVLEWVLTLAKLHARVLTSFI